MDSVKTFARWFLGLLVGVVAVLIVQGLVRQQMQYSYYIECMRGEETIIDTTPQQCVPEGGGPPIEAPYPFRHYVLLGL